MTNGNKALQLSRLTLAVTCAMLAMQARADNDEELALKLPANWISVGGSHVSQPSGKFGEYNGLYRDRSYLDLNFAIRGGSGYQRNEVGETLRWSAFGSDLGLDSRSLGAAVSNQGKWNIGAGYDALTHYTSNAYQTPYVGAGSNTLLLPAGFGTAANTNSLSATQLAAFHPQDVRTKRENSSLFGAIYLTPHLSVNLDFNHLDQSGSKLMAFGAASKVGGATAQAISVLPMPTKYQTDTVTLGMNWSGEKGRLGASYYGSFFKDSYDRVSYQTFAGTSGMQTLPTAPSNELHQLNLDGNYAFTQKTRLVGGFSYGRNTQNAPFAVDAGLLNAPLPATSLNGLVITRNANVKLTDQSIKDLTLSAGFKYNERDNRTQSYIYQFSAINATDTAAYPNTPLSTKKFQYELAGDYRLSGTQSARMAYLYDDMRRQCKQYAVSATYPQGINCVVATKTVEDKIETGYRLKATEDLDLRVSYAYGHRATDSDRYAKAAFSGNANGLGAGVNGADMYGYYPFFDASRIEQVFKGSSNWQATEQLSFSLGGRYMVDSYDDSTYGVQHGYGWSANLDTSYAFNDKASVSMYLTQQYRRRDLLTLNAFPSNAWTNALQDQDTTIGLGFKQEGLLAGKLDLSSNLDYISGRTSYNTQVPYLATCGSPATLTCGELPDIKSRTLQLKLTGSYKLDRHSQFVVQYVYANMHSTDYLYNTYQYGYTANTVMPTNEQAARYSLNVVSAAYVYNF